MTYIEWQLLTVLNRLLKGTTANSFNFSLSKTVCMHLCCQRGIHPDPELCIGKVVLPVVPDETKFLWLIFDCKLTFIPHIKQLHVKCTRALNILHVLSSTIRGVDRCSVPKIYHSLLCLKLDYGSLVYGFARPPPQRCCTPFIIRDFGSSPGLSVFTWFGAHT
ncbi:uncharacterized protein LOC143239280 [Tachypleus tridentatus]|uniref:uncharacterized protein LOC143239280 n=1 Tax=Tachypleus tridentatus TaxID=6853 RepID=UPI003FD1808C